MERRLWYTVTHFLSSWLHYWIRGYPSYLLNGMLILAIRGLRGTLPRVEWGWIKVAGFCLAGGGLLLYIMDWFGCFEQKEQPLIPPARVIDNRGSR